MSEQVLPPNPFSACLDQLERRLPESVVHGARDRARGRGPQYGRFNRPPRDPYVYRDASSTFREAFRQETPLDPWRDGYASPSRNASTWGGISKTTEIGPSALPDHVFASAAASVLSWADIDEIIEFSARRGVPISVPFDDAGSPIGGFTALLTGAETSGGVSHVLGSRHGPVVVATSTAIVLARALDVAQEDVRAGRPDFGVGTLTVVAEPLLSLAKAAVLMRAATERGDDISSRSDFQELEKALEGYREYVWSAVRAYEMVRSEHIAATNAIAADIEQIRREDQQWENLVTASELVATTPPPPSLSSGPSPLQVNMGSPRPAPPERHKQGCLCLGCR